MRNANLHLGDCLSQMRQMGDNSIDTIITDPPYGLRFMGKKWDYEIPSVEAFQEMLRVAKPGATLLCFGGTRTWHRIACNIEDAGWEIRDTLMWLYGSGFPKSLNIGKAIDKLQGNQRKDLGEYEPFGRDFEGWGTALKPAFEPIIMAMKKNEGSYAENALKWGVAGLNIDESRILIDSIDNIHAKNPQDVLYEVPKGRFPANLLLDEESARILDEMSGNRKTGTVTPQNISRTNGNTYGKPSQNCNQESYGGGQGGASRFFYTAKASKSERNNGCEELESQIGHNRFDTCEKCSGTIFQNPDRPSACKCLTPVRKHNTIKGNFHPTIKPLKLMEYLCTLTKTPTGGIVLDPYMGSGTTGMACFKTGRKFIGIEILEEYFDIACKRIEEAQGQLPIFELCMKKEENLATE